MNSSVLLEGSSVESSVEAKGRVKQNLSSGHMLAYASPAAAIFLFYTPMLSILPSIYAKYFGLELTGIAAVVLLSRIFDGITDPVIGYYSDRHRTNGGSRKLWAISGCLGIAIASFFLFSPVMVPNLSYFFFWSFVFYIAFTVAEIPHTTWGSELATDYTDRASIYGFRVLASQLGILAFYTFPLLPFYATSEYTPTTLKHVLYVGFAVTLIALLWMSFGVPKRVVPGQQEQQQSQQSGWVELKVTWYALRHNKPLFTMLSAHITSGLALGMWLGLLYFYLDFYLGLGGSMALIFTLATLIAAVMTPVWPKIIAVTNKQFAWSLSMLVFVAQMLLMSFLEAGTPWWVPMLLIASAYCSMGCNSVALLSILGDISDYGQLRFKKNYGATYFAVNGVVFKAGLGIGSGIALAVAGSYGFNPSASSNSAEAIEGLTLGFLYLPIVMSLLSIIFIIKIPITRRRFDIIHKRLGQLRHRARV